MERQARDSAAARLKSFVDRAKAFQMAGPFRLIRPTKRSNVPGPIARPDDGNDDQDGNRGWPRTYRYDHLPLDRALRHGQHAKRIRRPWCGGSARGQIVGRSDATVDRIFQHWARSDAARDGHFLCVLKKAAAIANRDGRRLDDQRYELIVQVCDEILAGQHHDVFPLHVWMTGSGTQFNMNVNEVISNRCCQLAGTPLGSKMPVHPNDHVNTSQSSNDTFPSAMYMVAAGEVKRRLIPSVSTLRDSIDAKAHAWTDIVKIGRTHLQDATPLTLGQEWSGYAAMLTDNLERTEAALPWAYQLALGDIAVGTGISAPPGFAEAATEALARLTGLPFITVPKKFVAHGAHGGLVQLSGTLRTLAVSM
jgi:fumarate hydratase class II